MYRKVGVMRNDGELGKGCDYRGREVGGRKC